MSEMISGSPMWLSWPLMMLVYAALIIVPFWFIFRKAGYSQWLSVLMIVPIINLGMLYFLTFSDWSKVREREIKQG